MKNRTISVLLAVMLALAVGLIGCGSEEVPEITEYHLTISSTEGGSVITPGEGAGSFTYDEGEVVDLVAQADQGYRFVDWTGDVSDIANVNIASTTVTMNGNYEITANFEAIPPGKYSLTIHSTTGGSVTNPGLGTSTYDKGTTVDLVATPSSGYQFINWSGDINTIANVSAASTTIAMNGYYTITANFAIGVYNWHDLDAVRDNLDGSYVLMNDLDSTTAGYTELAGATANGGKGWKPIGSVFESDPGVFNPIDPFTGRFDGQGYEIRGLFLNRPSEDGIGLFGSVDRGSLIENLALMSAEVVGHFHIGVLVGWNGGIVSESHSSGSVAGVNNVGGLVGVNDWKGIVSNSSSLGSIIGSWMIGGLVGWNWGTISDCYSNSTVNGQWLIGGLVGRHDGTISSCHFGGSVIAHDSVGALVGVNYGILGNSHYDYDKVLINGKKMITVGALFTEDFDDWLANAKFLDVNERLAKEGGYYVIDSIGDFKQLLAFGQNASMKFRLNNDLDLSQELSFYIPFLAGEFDGNGHKISNLSLSLDSVSGIGLFGVLAPGATVNELGADNVDITGGDSVGGLVGWNEGTVSDSYSTGNVIGWRGVGGLVGVNFYVGSTKNSYFIGAVTGDQVGGLVANGEGTVINSYYDYDMTLINGQRVITIGALFTEDFDQWLANGKSLGVTGRLSQKDGYYLINDVSDFKQLLAFGQDGSLKFRLTTDLDLGGDPNFFIPYLAGEFDGNGHKISNLNFSFSSVSQVGLFGSLAPGGRVSKVGVEDTNITGAVAIGALVGRNFRGIVSNSYSTGSVTGGGFVGGLVGENRGTISNSYSTCSVTGSGYVGGLAGQSHEGTVSNSYSSGHVGGTEYYVGGLVGAYYASVSNSFWDMESSGQSTSACGTGKTTAQMKSIATFAGWNIVAVANPDTSNTAYTWNMVDGQTYPFLSWQSVS